MVYVKRYKTLLFIDFALKILKKHEEDEGPLPKMSIQNINEYLKEGSGIIAFKQLPITVFNRLVIKKNLIGKETTEVSLPFHASIAFFLTSKNLNLN